MFFPITLSELQDLDFYWLYSITFLLQIKKKSKIEKRYCGENLQKSRMEPTVSKTKNGTIWSNHQQLLSPTQITWSYSADEIFWSNLLAKDPKLLCETCTQASWHKTNITLLPNGLAMPNNPSTVNRTQTLLIQCHFQYFAFETDELISGQLICFKIIGSSHSSVWKAEMLDGFYK